MLLDLIGRIVAVDVVEGCHSRGSGNSELASAAGSPVVGLSVAHPCCTVLFSQSMPTMSLRLGTKPDPSLAAGRGSMGMWEHTGTSH